MQTITTTCTVFLIASVLQTLSECKIPYKEVEELVAVNSCYDWTLSRVYRSFLICILVFFSYYIQLLVYSGLFIEKERIKRQKVQLNRYFNNQKNGILVVRDGCELAEENKVLLCNKAMEEFTGLSGSDEASLFLSRCFTVQNQNNEHNDMSFESQDEQQKGPSQQYTLWEIYQLALQQQKDETEQ